MKTMSKAIIAALFLIPCTHHASPLGTAFTYQGRLDDGGNPAQGIYDLRFTIYDLDSGGSPVAGPVTNAAVAISNGLFTVTLDFGGSVFTGDARWLGIGVRTSGAPADFATLSPRQPLTPAPYALSASNLVGTLPATQLSGTLASAQFGGTYSSVVTLDNPANLFSGSGAGLTAVDADLLDGYHAGAFAVSGHSHYAPDVVVGGGTLADGLLAANVARTNQVWLWNGNRGTTPGTHFLGTADNQPLELKVNNRRVLRIEPNTNRAANVIAGSANNSVAPGVLGAVIAGGGINQYDFDLVNHVAAHFGVVAGGGMNTIMSGADYSVMGGGSYNNIGDHCIYSTIPGGYFNLIGAEAAYSTIAGGNLHNIGTNSSNATIGGGRDNNIGYNAEYAAIAGGHWNDIGNYSDYGAIGGGDNNNIADYSAYSTIAGGGANDIGIYSASSTIGGGNDNNIAEYAPNSAIAGGSGNDIGTNADYSAIAGGLNNDIDTDSQRAVIAGGDSNDIGTNSSYTTIGGGYRNRITNNANYATIPGGYQNLATNLAFAAGSGAKAYHSGAFVWGDSNFGDVASTNANSVTMRAAGGYRLFSNSGVTAGVYLAPGSGSWASMSDRNAKEHLQTVDAAGMLAKVAALPLATWNYKSQDASVRHLGPMAQDFRAAFGLGESDTGISGVDADGVALAAIQGLNQKLEQKETEITELKRRLQRLERLVNSNNRGEQ